MQQLREQALALTIYEDITITLYQILKHLETQKLFMENTIKQLQQQIIIKDHRISQLTNKLNTINPQKSPKTNLITLPNHLQSQPLIAQNIQKTHNYQQNPFKIDINSYFTSLINQINQKSSKSIKNTHESLHYHQSSKKLLSVTDDPQSLCSNQKSTHFLQQNKQIEYNSLSKQKTPKKHQNQSTLIKQLFSSTSQKQNQYHHLKIKQQKSNPIYINSNENQQNLFSFSNKQNYPKQLTQKGWKNFNFIHKNIKSRKIPLTVIKTSNFKVQTIQIN